MGKERTNQGGERKGNLKEGGEQQRLRPAVGQWVLGCGQQCFLDFGHKVQMSPLRKSCLTSGSLSVPLLPLWLFPRPVSPKPARPRTPQRSPRQKGTTGSTAQRDAPWNVSVWPGSRTCCLALQPPRWTPSSERAWSLTLGGADP